MTTRSITSSETSGRAASCTRITAASSATSPTPIRTDSPRVSPPATDATTFPQPSSSARRIAGSSQSGGATTTIDSIQPEASSRSRLSARSGRPRRGANALGGPRRAARRDLLRRERPRRTTEMRPRARRLRPRRPWCVFFFEPPTAESTSSSQTPASSSSISFAYISSLARIFFALTNICFSPVERPFSWSRRERFRTTSASSKMSPVFILSRLCLKRRFQFFGIDGAGALERLQDLLDHLLVDHARAARRASAFSHGTLHGHVVVQDLDRQVLALLAEHLALLLLDDRACPVVRIHHLVADLEQPTPPFEACSRQDAGGVMPPAKNHKCSEFGSKEPTFQGF